MLRFRLMYNKRRYYFYNVDVDECAFNSTKQLPFPSPLCNLLNIFKHSPVVCLYA